MLNQKDTFLITVSEQILHFTGVYAEGYLLLGEINCLFTDKRYLYAVSQNITCDIEVREGGVDEVIKAITNLECIGVDYATTSVALYNKLVATVTVEDMGLEINRLIAKKSKSQIGLIQSACKITEKAFLGTIPFIKEGVTEREVSNVLESNFKRLGASGLAFETIVAFGANSAVPHHQTGETKLERGMPILMDFGCKYNGFCSDMTRTLFFGTPSDRFISCYESVKRAHLKAKSEIASGMTGKECDAIARESLKADNLDTYFTHSLGHGIGTLIHEFPALSPRCSEPLSDGNVFSIEPGVYFDGEFGIRIEDSVYLDAGKVKSFMIDDLELKIIK